VEVQVDGVLENKEKKDSGMNGGGEWSREREWSQETTQRFVVSP